MNSSTIESFQHWCGPHGLLMASVIAVGATCTYADNDEEWPQEIESPSGLVVMYQPQVDRLDGDQLYARAAASVTQTGTSDPIFGALWLESRIRTDTDSRMVRLQDARVSRVRFPDATPEDENKLAEMLTREIPSWDLELSLDRLLAMLDIAEKQDLASQDFNTDSPRVIVVDHPAVLVTFDGKPELRSVKGSELQVVINTPFSIFVDRAKGACYLYGGTKSWYWAPHPEGPWVVAPSVPSYVRNLAPRDEEMVLTQTGSESVTPPAIITATEPTELLVTDGPPEYVPVADGQLLYLSNSESDMLREVATQDFFILLSGRWYKAPSLEGPWAFVPAGDLPESFSQIPADSERGHLLTWVPGTEMAKDAVLDAHIPQTAAVRRDATIEVTYDGEPQFEDIEGTDLAYAVNTQFDVLRSGSVYYCAHEAVWYVADNPLGPWRVADEIPDRIQALPADCPLYHCRYLHVYESTPEVVYVGYYPGYLHSYVYHGCLVYGTGWHYRPWRGRYWYYPRPRTYGMHARWNPWHGWGFGFSYSTGRYTFALGTGSAYRRSWWGSGGYRGYQAGHYRGWNQGYVQGRRDGYQTARRHTTRNIYQHGANVGKVVGGGVAAAAVTSAARPTISGDRANNVFADNNGNVYRRQADGSWQTRQNNQWVNTPLGSLSTASNRSAANRPAARPATATSTVRPTGQTVATIYPNTTRATSVATPRPAAPAVTTSSLNRDAQVRQHGTQRTNVSKARTASPSRSRPAASGARRGGGRR